MKRPLTEQEIGRIKEIAGARSHYELLALAPGASKEHVDSAYRAFVREWHPDRFFSRDTGEYKTTIETNFVAATSAYDTLRDDRKRREYDNAHPGLSAPRPAPRPSVARPVPPRPPPAPAPPPPPPPEPEVPGYEVTFGRPAAAAPAVAPAPPAPAPVAPPRPPPSPTANAIAAMRAQIQAQQTKAQAYYDAAKADFDAGRFIKADSSIYLALKIAPQNPTYLELQKVIQEKARGQRADQHIAVAEQADQYGRGKEAITALEQAVACDPPDGKAFYLLGRARKASGESAAPKDLLPLYKKAAARSPKVFEYRMAVAEIYEQLGMTANAHREATAAVELNPKSDVAKQLQRRTRP